MNDTPPRRTALITGASAGIGAAFARVFAERGFDLILTARREDRLEALAGELSRRHGAAVRTVVADLGDPAAVERVCGWAVKEDARVDALVNNAGYGLACPYSASSWQRQRDMIQVMVTSVAELTHRLLPGMIARRYGRIVNVSSVAALLPGAPGATLYAATKAFLIKFSQSLAMELSDSGINVTALCPGLTWSEFHDVTGTRERMNRLPRWVWQDADAVAREGYDAVMRGRMVHVSGRFNRALAFLLRVTPDRVVLAAARRHNRHAVPGPE
jgi:uncharacterized protein